MKQSKLLIPTLRETPADLQTDSHQLLVKAGFIRQLASGIYTYLPLAVRVLNKIKKIIQEELEKIDAVEILTPNLIPAEMLEKTGRQELFGEDLFTLEDRTQRPFVLAPTAEEIFASLLFAENFSYKRFPYHLYQIQRKYRDESKAKYGLIRSREFLMADMYSFHMDSLSLEEGFRQYEELFQRVFQRCHIAFVSVVGDSGIMGGEESKEFVALAEIGDETIVRSSKGDYVSDLTLAKSYFEEKKSHEAFGALTEVQSTRKELFKNDLDETKLTKAYLYKVDNQETLLLLPFSEELNETKVKLFFKGRKIEKVKENILLKQMPLTDYNVYLDQTVAQLNNLILPAGKGKYWLNVNETRDFTLSGKGDFLTVKPQNLAPDGIGTLEFQSGVEIGHIFKLSDRYSQQMQGFYLDDEGQKQAIEMGSYGIGISRLLQVIAEQHHDDNGITWPKAVTPYDLHIIPVNLNEADQQNLLTEVLESLAKTQYSYLVDDRNEHVGVKFADSDLIGCVLRIVIGKKAHDGILEITLRQSGEKVEVKKEDLIDILPILYDSAF